MSGGDIIAADVKREQLEMFEKLLPESQGQNLTAVWYMCHVRSAQVSKDWRGAWL